METLEETTRLLNSFDYIFLAYSLLQIYHGLTQGFRIMLFETVKWLILIGVIFFSNKVLYPHLMTREDFVNLAQRVNEWGYQAVTSVLKSDNPFKDLLYTEIAKSIPYDKITFFLAILLVVGILSRLVILASVFKRERQGRLLGAVFGLAKSILVTFLIMNILAGFMMSANPEGFVKWQEESLILSRTGQSFTGDRFAKQKEEFLEKIDEKWKNED